MNTIWKNKKLFIQLLLCCAVVTASILILYTIVNSAAPLVKNVHAQQRSGTRLVDITYDVSDPEGAPLNISVAASGDGGKTYNITPKSVTGDVGRGIMPGNGKKIVWDAGKDVPGTRGNSFRVRLVADDGEAPEDMVLIPAGEFQMGDNFNDGDSDERPVHTVYLDAFYIDKYEVTNAQYKKFMDATGYKAPAYWNDPNYNAPNNPVVGVIWNDAKAYADWAGERLPTEAEWEKAARGGLVGKRYPWGDDITHDNANYSGTGGKDIWTYTSPVGSFAPNGYGLYDMAGNVWEWCADWYDNSYYANSPKQNPKGPNSGTWQVLRGGSWNYDNAYRLRVAYRISNDPTYANVNVGFRCVQ